MFWGCVVQEGKEARPSFEPSSVLHLTNITLSPNTKGKCLLKIRTVHNSKKLIICSLEEGRVDQRTLDLYLLESDNPVLTVTRGEVHVSGYFEPSNEQPEGNSEMTLEKVGVDQAESENEIENDSSEDEDDEDFDPNEVEDNEELEEEPKTPKENLDKAFKELKKLGNSSELQKNKEAKKEYLRLLKSYQKVIDSTTTLTELKKSKGASSAKEETSWKKPLKDREETSFPRKIAKEKIEKDSKKNRKKLRENQSKEQKMILENQAEDDEGDKTFTSSDADEESEEIQSYRSSEQEEEEVDEYDHEEQEAKRPVENLRENIKKEERPVYKDESIGSSSSDDEKENIKREKDKEAILVKEQGLDESDSDLDQKQLKRDNRNPQSDLSDIDEAEEAVVTKRLLEKRSKVANKHKKAPKKPQYTEKQESQMKIEGERANNKGFRIGLPVLGERKLNVPETEEKFKGTEKKDKGPAGIQRERKEELRTKHMAKAAGKKHQLLKALKA